MKFKTGDTVVNGKKEAVICGECQLTEALEIIHRFGDNRVVFEENGQSYVQVHYTPLNEVSTYVRPFVIYNASAWSLKHDDDD